MILSEEEQKQTEQYDFDFVKTLQSNIVLLIITSLVFVYVVIYNSMVKDFTLPEMKIIGVFILAWSMVKILLSISNNINFEYKPRK